MLMISIRKVIIIVCFILNVLCKLTEYVDAKCGEIRHDDTEDVQSELNHEFMMDVGNCDCLSLKLT